LKASSIRNARRTRNPLTFACALFRLASRISPLPLREQGRAWLKASFDDIGALDRESGGKVLLIPV
jgi:hypothetical protein